eukprot:4452933-Karenia_brevis.AAC.1
MDVISSHAAIPRVVLWQCGYLGVRIGEAAHPGPEGVSLSSQAPATELDSDIDAGSTPVNGDPMQVGVAELNEQI